MGINIMLKCSTCQIIIGLQDVTDNDTIRGKWLNEIYHENNYLQDMFQLTEKIT